jgi:hypothetical protein
MRQHPGRGPEFGAGIKCAVERGWLELHLCPAVEERGRQLRRPYLSTKWSVPVIRANVLGFF